MCAVIAGERRAQHHGRPDEMGIVLRYSLSERQLAIADHRRCMGAGAGQRPVDINKSRSSTVYAPQALTPSNSRRSTCGLSSSSSPSPDALSSECGFSPGMLIAVPGPGSRRLFGCFSCCARRGRLRVSVSAVRDPRVESLDRISDARAFFDECGGQARAVPSFSASAVLGSTPEF